MTDFVVEHVIKMSLGGKEMFSVFHTLDVTGLPTFVSIHTAFGTGWVAGVKQVQNNDLTYISITSTPLNALDIRNALTTPLASVGDIAGGQYMPTGVHVWAKLNITAVGLRSGGKMIPGLDEGGFDLGVPDQSVLDEITDAIQALITLLNAIGVFLAIYHRVFSSPGLPVASIVESGIARGGSTNNRRRLSFVQ